jgi:hypothetical protein
MKVDYERKYKEALKIMESLYNVVRYQSSSDALLASQTIEKAFPELKESKDERIKRCIGMCLTDATEQRFEDFNTNLKDCLAWLEKQVEQKPVDKVEPKFKVGDWVIYECGEETATLQITRIVGETYVFSDNSTLGVVDEDALRLWDITKDAKAGDVLAVTMYPEGTWIGMFKEHNGCTFSSYCFVNTKGTFKLGTYNHGNGKAIHPATKEQRDLLFQKMREAGYEWDAEKKELKKIEQKPSWSEEDENHLKNCIAYFRTIEKTSPFYEDYLWLKSLSPQPHWKPNEEQMEALNAINNVGELSYVGQADLLIKLYNDLEKL